MIKIIRSKNNIVLSRNNLRRSRKESYLYIKKVLEIYGIVGTRDRVVTRVYTIGLYNRFRTRN